MSILGSTFLGLLDSGASCTIIGKSGWNVLKSFNVRLTKRPTISCTVANGEQCEVLGVISVPIQLKSVVKIVDIFVVPSIPHALILGLDFWRTMGIIPNLCNNEWTFSADPVCVHSVLLPQTELLPEQHFRLNKLLDQVFADGSSRLGCTHLVEHQTVTNSEPIKQRYYPISPVVQKSIHNELDMMLKDGTVESLTSPWASPIVLVRKKDQTYRFCVDFRKLNKVTVKNAYPLPMVSVTLDKLRNAHYLSTLDIKSAFWQIPMAEDSKKYTAFTVPNRGLFQFRRMPFGLCNAPAIWQRLMDRVLGSDLEPNVFVYLDDVAIVTEKFDKHVSVLQEVFLRLKAAGLTVSREKCFFCKFELKYLGYIVYRNGLHVDNDKVSAILNIPTPTTVSEVRRIIGMTSWYRRFVKDFSTLTSPLTRLLRKGARFVSN